MFKKLLVALVAVCPLVVPAAIHRGVPIPSFKISLLDGKEVSEKSLRGKVVVLDFWATWCGPCRMVSKVMQKMHESYASKGVQVICVDVQEHEPTLIAVQRYRAQHHYTYDFSVKNNNLDQRLNVTSLPTVIILDRKGNVQYRSTGFYPQKTESDIDGVLKKLAG